MNDTTLSSEIAGPYAKALMSVAQDNDAVEQVGNEVAELLEVLASSEELTVFLMNPLMSANTKKGVLRQIADGKVSDFLLSFLLLLVDRGRVAFLKPVLQQYQALLRELNQTVLADVTAAVDLSDEQLQAIRDRVQAMTGANSVELSVQVDPALIGGLVIKVGSQVIDASLRGQLRRIGMQLATTP
ncbi:F0F1 ATP synthase subunit delta [Nodosilinea sp. LEGE 07088]|uniref:ATP synthase F1 subunit delta n=1 Tax=Nodosilinea sp. LEGE 07088 TaxID=2777968 RepID=UPI001881294A|nr:ATP synthase F1 subunit delta [Nodosilinea sp. LEGE 07088]MBE9136570.1 F0F1 ATP synthase subunit delta [Nodosilinea sp. LEGE 07088]